MKIEHHILDSSEQFGINEMIIVDLKSEIYVNKI
jgi:hypothetical protein